MSELKRELKLRDQIIMGIAGAMGCGILFSIAGMTAHTGSGVIFALILGGIIYTFIGLTYVELGQLWPEAGGPSRYSLYTHGRTTNMINAFADMIWYLFIPPIEALAVVLGLNTFWPHLIQAGGNPTVLGALLAVVFLILFLPFNYFGVKNFARATNLLGGIKLVIFLLVAIGFINFAQYNNFTSYGGWVPFGIKGIWAAIPLGMFLFGGIRVLPDYAEEVKGVKDLTRSVLWTVAGQTIYYVLFGVAFIAALNWSKLNLKPGNWSSLSGLAGNPFLVIANASGVKWLFLITAILAILSPFVTGYVYQGAGSRVLLAMSRSGLVSAKLQQISNKYSIPTWALVIVAVIGAIVAYISAPLPSIYGLITDSVVAGYLGFVVNPVVMLALRKDKKPTILKFGQVIAVLAFIGSSLVVYWSGWPCVPYAVVLLALSCLIFGLIYKVNSQFVNALWYIVYILFMTLMTYIGGVGAKNLVSVDLGSVIVCLVDVIVFLPWGVASRVREFTTGTSKDSGTSIT